MWHLETEMFEPGVLSQMGFIYLIAMYFTFTSIYTIDILGVSRSSRWEVTPYLLAAVNIAGPFGTARHPKAI